MPHDLSIENLPTANTCLWSLRIRQTLEQGKLDGWCEANGQIHEIPRVLGRFLAHALRPLTPNPAGGVPARADHETLSIAGRKLQQAGQLDRKGQIERAVSGSSPPHAPR